MYQLMSSPLAKFFLISVQAGTKENRHDGGDRLGGSVSALLPQPILIQGIDQGLKPAFN
jgi:hypothetical protein